MLLFALNLRMHLAFSFVLLFGALGSTLAEDCFSGNGAVTVLNPSCTGSTLLKVETAQLEVDFKWKGAYSSNSEQKLTFVFGGCLVNAKLQGSTEPQFRINSKTRDLPLTFVVGRSKVVIKKEGELNIEVKCTSSFEKIPNSSAFKISIAYRADKPEDLKSMLVTYHGSIYEVKPNNKIYTKVWFWIVVGLVCYLLVGAIIVGVVIFLYKKAKKEGKKKELMMKQTKKIETCWAKSEGWQWPTESYTDRDLDHLLSFFPNMYSSNQHLHVIYIQAFLEKHPINEKQLAALEKEVEFWLLKTYQNSAPSKLQHYKQIHTLLDTILSIWKVNQKMNTESNANKTVK
ncbi:hypothetical protein M3Y96_00323900 [Aphelenchoides besseyi]|nr:hypothetical protein M3Y96_00323900 [Aphelenchoides besseyi]